MFPRVQHVTMVNIEERQLHNYATSMTKICGNIPEKNEGRHRVTGCSYLQTQGHMHLGFLGNHLNIL